MKKKVGIALSGGMDSACAALLLKEQGYEVFGITLQFQHEFASQIPHIEALCSQLNIPLYIRKIEKQFKSAIIDNFCEEYLSGKTPNPCIRCNRLIKWGILLDEVLALGGNFLATGHYAKIVKNPHSKRIELHTATDKHKDQSYFLWQLTQHQLSHTLFPLSAFSKKQIKDKIYTAGLLPHHPKESQEICFIPNDDYKSYLKKHFPNKLIPGAIRSVNGTFLGTHKGLAYYTIGQRKGLGITAPQPLYVVALHTKNNELIVGPVKELYKQKLVAGSCNWIAIEKPTSLLRATAQIRYNTPAKPCIIDPDPSKQKITVVFDDPLMSITPGQSIVFYDHQRVLGGGIIEKSV